MLIYSMGVSVDGFIADRDGAFGWTDPGEEQFRFHLAQVRELGAYLCGRRLYETMLVWETDPSLRDSEDRTAFADVWCAIPKVVFSRTLDSVQGNARLAEASVAEEAAAALDATDKDVSIGGAGLAAAAIELGLVDAGTPYRAGCPRYSRPWCSCSEGANEEPMIKPSAVSSRATVWPHGSSRGACRSANPRSSSSPAAALTASASASSNSLDACGTERWAGHSGRSKHAWAASRSGQIAKCLQETDASRRWSDSSGAR
jgi:dihydrofolate reductase